MKSSGEISVVGSYVGCNDAVDADKLSYRLVLCGGLNGVVGPPFNVHVKLGD